MLIMFVCHLVLPVPPAVCLVLSVEGCISEGWESKKDGMDGQRCVCCVERLPN